MSAIVGDGNQAKVSRKVIEDAGSDAAFLMKESPLISKLMGVDLVARQLFMLVRSTLEAEVKTNWEVEQPDLVIRMLGMSTERRAVDNPVTATYLRDTLLLEVIPVLDIFCKMEEEHAAAGPTGPVLVSGVDDSPTEGLGPISVSSDCDTEQQAGERGEGAGGEAGSP